MADTPADANPYTQRPNVYERMWVWVSKENDIWKFCCSVLADMTEEARAKKRQFAACKKCAAIFFPFPDDYHMHELSDKFKTRVDARTSEGDCESLPWRALVGLAKEAKAYEERGGEEFIKIIRIVRGTRSNQGDVKYDRFELCENNKVECWETTSKKSFQARNLAVGILKLVIQLHFKIPIRSDLVDPRYHGAGICDYFQRYRHLVPEFENETLFRCFLAAFGKHVMKATHFDSGFAYRSNWWIG